MADWNERTGHEMSELASQHGFSDALVAKLRQEIASWADMIGKEKSKLFDIGSRKVRATVENHEVTRVEMAE